MGLCCTEKGRERGLRARLYLLNNIDVDYILSNVIWSRIHCVIVIYPIASARAFEICPVKIAQQIPAKIQENNLRLIVRRAVAGFLLFFCDFCDCFLSVSRFNWCVCVCVLHICADNKSFCAINIVGRMFSWAYNNNYTMYTTYRERERTRIYGPCGFSRCFCLPSKRRRRRQRQKT